MAMAIAMAMGSRRFFNAGGRSITTESSFFFGEKDIPNLFRGWQTGGGRVRSFVTHQCNKSHMLPYFARSLASSSASQSSGQTPRQEPEKKKECQIKTSSELQRERCDGISSTKVSLNQFPGLMVHGNVEDSKTRRLLRLNPDTGYFEEQDVSAVVSNHHGHYELQVPHGHVCRGSAYGWLFLTDDNLNMKLSNPFSGAEIQLPPGKTLPQLPFSEWEEQYLSKWFVFKAVFSANPSIEPPPVVLVFYGLGGMTKLAFCKPGDKGWTPLELPEHSLPVDAIYHKDQFYVLGFPGSVVAFDIGRCIDDDDHSVKTVNVATPPPKKRVYFRDWYFVVLDGEFFRFEVRVVCLCDCCIDETMPLLEFERKRDGDTTDEDYFHERKITTDEENDEESDDSDEESDDSDEENDEESDDSDEESDDDDGVEESRNHECDLRLPGHTYGIKIRRFDVSEKQWVKVESLGDKAVFLGYNTSFALSASDYPAGVCIPDSVYFSYGSAGHEATQLRCYDVGIYNVKDKSVKPLYPPTQMDDEASQFLKPAPIWIVNSADRQIV